MELPNQTIEVKVVNLDEALEKANQLKSLLQEVKELAESLDIVATLNGKKV